MNDSARRWMCALLFTGACASDDAEDGTTQAASTGGADESTGTPGSSSGASESGSAADSSSGGSSGGGLCEDELPAIVTDIDETLTLSDEEFFMQVADPTYDPIEREGAAELINGYADLGYRIMYLTARGENLDIMGTDDTARDLTEQWLVDHGFPLDPDTTVVVLSEGLVIGDAAQEYKAGALMDQQALGWRFDYAYGNATSDIGAYADAGIALDETFIIGEHAGEEGTVAVEGEGWVEHTAAQLPMVPAVCEAS